METTRLVQRLRQPLGVGNPFAFGGGLRNGGLSEEAMGLLKDLWSFDYMGSAEFEFGAVPDSLNQIALCAVRKELIAFEMMLVAFDASMFVICSSKIKIEVQERIVLLSSPGQDGENVRLKEYTLLPQILSSEREREDDVCGWLELNNNFLFFLDKLMWAKATKFFGAENV